MTFQTGNKNSVRDGLDTLCCILVKNVAAFCQYPENLSEAELKNNGLFCLASGDVKTGEHLGYVMVIAFCSHPSLQ